MGHWAWWECLLGESVSVSHCWCMSFLAGPAPSALCLGLFQMKTGPFAEHSNQLWNISAVPSWSKVNQGLIRMYKAEVSAVGRGRLLGHTPPLFHSTMGQLLCCSRCGDPITAICYSLLTVAWEPLAIQVLLARRKLLPRVCPKTNPKVAVPCKHDFCHVLSYHSASADLQIRAYVFTCLFFWSTTILPARGNLI